MNLKKFIIIYLNNYVLGFKDLKILNFFQSYLLKTVSMLATNEVFE